MSFIDRIRGLKLDIKARSEERKSRVASDLAILISKAGLKRKEVAQRLEITEAALSIRLNGSGNLTLDSIGGVCDVAGYDFDVVFRRPEEAVAMSFWEMEEAMTPPVDASAVAADVSVAKVDVKAWLARLESRSVAGVLHYEVPSFTSAAANEPPALTKYDSKSLAA